MYHNFAKLCLTYGARLIPLEIPSNETEHTGICNPSIFVEENGDIKMILRNVNYALWNSDNEFRFTSPIGPLYYITPDNDLKLRTQNFLCTFIDGGIDYKKIDTSANDWQPIWDFVGHEDMRLVRWNGKLYGTGVQRDWNTTGIGRMHLSELDEETGKELSRVRIEAPVIKDSYCEKNWMPILDMPYHYVKWCTPTEVVKVNPETGESEVVCCIEQDENLEFYNTNGMAIRGSSQVLPWGDYRIALVHLCSLRINEKGQKCGTGYYGQFIVWDKDWNIVKLSTPFTFNHFGIEFTNGMAIRNHQFLIPFALQDNISFMLEIGEDFIRKFIFENDFSEGDYNVSGDMLLDFFGDSDNSYNSKRMGDYYFGQEHYAGAMVCYERACEYNTFNSIDELYACMYMVGLSLARLGNRDISELDIWTKLVNLDSSRSEGYLMLSKYYGWRGKASEAYMYAKLAVECNNYGYIGEYSDIWNHIDGEIELLINQYYTENYMEVKDKLLALLTRDLVDYQEDRVRKMLEVIENNQKNIERIL